MKTVDRVRLGLVQAAALAGAAAALAMGFALALPSSQGAQVLAKVFPLQEVHWSSAEAALTASPADADTAQALSEADAEVAVAPNRLQPYMQRAFIRVRAAHGALTPGALADFAHTYDLAPVDFSTAPWREQFAYNHWPELTTPLRISVMREHVLIWNMRQGDFAALDGRITNGAGRLAYRLTQRNAVAAFWANHTASAGGKDTR